ncbi:hypothetical protein SAMN04487930_10619 [Cytophaga hutchinsonii ATCC 33406]|nr:hypothetical protein SAMN04487930_10619 [Cytophaga hutchinsonii ATCC 33406]
MKNVGATLAVAPDNTMVTSDGTRAGNHQTHVHDWTGQQQGLPYSFALYSMIHLII